jgi:hypothetical protein
MSKFRELQAASTVLLGEIGELKKRISDEGHRFELKEVHHHRAQLESQKRGSCTYFQIAIGVILALEQEVYTAISSFKKQKSPASSMLLRPGLLRTSTLASERQGGMKDAPLHPLYELYGPRYHLVSESFNPLPFLYQRGVAYVLMWVVFAFRGLSWRVACLPGPLV